MPNYNFTCIDCNHYYEQVVKYEDRDLPGSAPCISCGSTNVERQFPTPMVNTSKSASLLDGQKRPGWDDAKALVKLKRKKANTNTAEGRAEIDREMAARKSTILRRETKGEQLPAGVKLAEDR